MPHSAKTFDCVDLKNQIQAEMLQEKLEIGEEEMRLRFQHWVETSNESLAAWWRSVRKRKTDAAK